MMKSIRLTYHAKEQCIERGAEEDEVLECIRSGKREKAKLGRELCRYNFSFKDFWQGEFYPIKQVCAVIKDEEKEIVVITVYTFYF